MTEKFGSGRFCSRACANSHSHSEESKLKTSNTIKKTIFDKHPEQFILVDDQLVKVKDGESHKVCSVCGKEISLDNKSGFCLNCLRYSDECFDFRSNQSKQTRDKLRAEGKQFGFPSRNITSYPEKFFEQVLDNNHIKYEREVKVINDHNCCYFLDFLIKVNGTKIDLEIDGAQHKKPERKKSDKIRDAYLSTNYIIYRIEWNEINTASGSNLMKEKINKFLDFYYKQIT
jgi:very-short-patch-repair endonuclease